MASDLFRLDGKIVAVVGAGGGIGEAVALACGAQGAHVVCLDIHGGNAVSVASKITAAGGSAESGVMDLVDEAQVEAGFNGIAEKHGKLDGLVCTPAINVRKPILKYSLAEFDKVVHLNLRGNFAALMVAGADHDRPEIRQHRPLLLDSIDRHRARTVGVLDDQGRHPPVGEDRGHGVGHAWACA